MSLPEGSELASAEQIREIADRAHDILLEALQEDWDDPEHEATNRLPLAFAALRFCARAAQELADPSLFDTIADPFVLRVSLENDFPEDDSEVLREATASLLARMTRLDARAIELASDPEAEVRLAIAQGLRPAVPGALALLRKLVADADPQVRAAARKSLGDAAEAPWWTGMLSADPASLVGEAKAAKLRPALDELLQKLSVAEHARAQTFPQIAKLARGLPRSIAAEIAERALLLAGYATKDSIEPLAKLMFAGPATDAALDRVLTRWCEQGPPFSQKDPMAMAVARLPTRQRTDHCRRLARIALAATEEDRLSTGSVATTGAGIAADAWPKSLDYGFVLDGIDAIERESGEGDAAVQALAGLLRQAAPRAAHVPRLVDRFAQPPSESWREIQWSIGEHLAKLPPPALRPIAERAAASAEGAVVRWGLELLASKAHLKTDPPVDDLLRAWVADARLAAAIAASPEIRVKALPWLLAKLREGQLEFAEAAEVIHAAGAGLGLFGRLSRSEPAADVTVEADHWAAYRLVRDAAPLEALDLWIQALNALPRGPRRAEDRAFVARAIEAVRHDRGLAHWVQYALTCASDEASLAEAAALVAVTSGDDRDKARKVRDEIATKLGVAPPAETVAVAPSATSQAAGALRRTGEWMDEPDE